MLFSAHHASYNECLDAEILMAMTMQFYTNFKSLMFMYHGFKSHLRQLKTRFLFVVLYNMINVRFVLT